MDIANQAEIVLRNEQYETWSWSGPNGPVTCFESAAAMGFVHVFETSAALIAGWPGTQHTTLARYAASLRGAGDKAWNVYSVFLTAERAPSNARVVERIEEDFTLTRKIARTAVTTTEDVERALTPLLRIRAQPLLGATNFEDRLRTRLKDVPANAVTAFLNETPAVNVARILGAKS
ncbi:hypothetical protein [Leisingera daeponensis]|uniref:hypothetical protein n=1 Tax=Leisingera daeponensis TaxID=405746 RepID=UPI000A04541A|nr:hypothetical protein [Leisingera daeponensis]